MKTTFPIFLLSVAALTSVSPAAAQSTLPKRRVVAFSAEDQSRYADGYGE